MNNSLLVLIASASMTIVSSFTVVAQNKTTFGQFQSFTPAQFSLNQGLTSTSSAPTGRLSAGSRPAKSTGRTTSNRSANNTQFIASQIQQALNRSANARSKAPVNTQLVSPGQQQALQELSRKAIGSQGVRAYFDSSSGTPTFIKLETKPAALAMRGVGEDIAKTVARRFLQDNKDLLKLENPDSEMLLRHSKTDASGLQHLTFQQQINDVPVWGGELKVHLKADNSVYLMNGRFHPSFTNLNTQASLSSAQAELAVLKKLSVTSAKQMNTELVVYKTDNGQAVLTYLVDIETAMDKRWIYFVDAHNGKVVHVINKILHAGTVAPSQAADELGITRTFNSWSENGIFYMIDPTFPLDDPAYDPLNENKAKGDTIILDVQNGDGSQLSYSTSNSATTGWDPTAVSAMANTQVVYDYFKETHGRNGIDDDNKNFLIAIHFKTDLNNAFWNGTTMVFGDGDGQIFGSLVKCLDVTAHEMSHGVIETSAALKYENQSGALNESMADIFGAMVDRDDWTLGEDCVIADPGFLRSMQNPAQGLNTQPTKMSEFINLPNTPEGDNGGVHVNSGIPNRAAYLIAEGLTAEGLGNSIGKDKMEAVFYRALTTYLTASSQFADARKATIQAAEDIHGAGSAEALSVAAGWDAVEVFDSGAQAAPTPTNSNPTPTDAVTGDDLMFYLYPVDKTRDFNVNDQYLLYGQIMSEVNGVLEYVQSNDVQLSNTQTSHSNSRLAVFTDNIGTLVLFIGSDNNVYMLDLNDDSEVQLTDTGDIWSIAISPDAAYVAYTSTNAIDDNIHVINIATGVVSDYPITPPDYSGDGSQGLGTVQYADAISFDYTSKTLVFDALNCVSTDSSSCASGGGYKYWSIGMMDASSGNLFYPFPNQNPSIDLAFPSFAQNNNYVVALDYSDYSSGTSVNSQVLTINFENQQTQLIHDFGTNAGAIFGTPSFWGDDNFVTIQSPTLTTAGTIAQRIPLTDQWENAGAAEGINTFAVAIPIMHRAGQRDLTGSIVVSANNINFGDLDLETQADQTVTLSNNGNSDVNITNISLLGINFSHNGTNTLLPRQSSITITVRFNAGSTVGAKTGTLTFSSDVGDQAISLTGNSIDSSATTETPTESSSGGGGGGSSNLPMLSVLIFMFLVRRRKIKVH